MPFPHKHTTTELIIKSKRKGQAMTVRSNLPLQKHDFRSENNFQKTEITLDS